MRGAMKLRIFSLSLVTLIGAGCAEDVEIVDDVDDLPSGPVSLVEGASYPEGPLWQGDTLYYVEYASHRVMAWERGESRVVLERPGCGPAGLVALGNGNLMVSCYDQGALVELGRDGRQVRVLTSINGMVWNGPNDFVADGAGGLYFSASGVFDASAPVAGNVYHLDANGNVQLVAESIHYANGLALIDGGRTLLVSEHLENRVIAYDVGNGKLDHRRVWADLGAIPSPKAAVEDPAYLGPDGMELGPDGLVYVAQYGGGRVLAFTQTGELAKELVVDAGMYPTNVTLRGDRAYVTVVTDMTAESAYRGALVAIPND